MKVSASALSPLIVLSAAWYAAAFVPASLTTSTTRQSAAFVAKTKSPYNNGVGVPSSRRASLLLRSTATDTHKETFEFTVRVY
jgi:hypothetical protein